MTDNRPDPDDIEGPYIFPLMSPEAYFYQDGQAIFRHFMSAFSPHPSPNEEDQLDSFVNDIGNFQVRDVRNNGHSEFSSPWLTPRSEYEEDQLAPTSNVNAEGGYFNIEGSDIERDEWLPPRSLTTLSIFEELMAQIEGGDSSRTENSTSDRNSSEYNSTESPLSEDF
ncbi:unnamed protein product [Rodentolepis nana]|uniref:NAC domain-containing protein n=1 Tax=Rodentolepis nana TaxID=102285 RepID=A0A0R3U0Q5_RODNA|nr:unnamed protein product [Rodentolepis nana]